MLIVSLSDHDLYPDNCTNDGGTKTLPTCDIILDFECYLELLTCTSRWCFCNSKSLLSTSWFLTDLQSNFAFPYILFIINPRTFCCFFWPRQNSRWRHQSGFFLDNEVLKNYNEILFWYLNFFFLLMRCFADEMSSREFFHCTWNKKLSKRQNCHKEEAWIY